MDAQTVTLIAALIAALTSVVTLGLNARLAILREKRMLLWQKELDRLVELEEIAGVAQEIARSYARPELVEKEFHPLHDKLRHAAGQFGRYPELAKAIRELNHSCAVTVAEKVKSGDSREWQRRSLRHIRNLLLNVIELQNVMKHSQRLIEKDSKCLNSN